MTIEEIDAVIAECRREKKSKAKASEAILVTGNTKHCPNEEFIMSPAEFLQNFAN